MALGVARPVATRVAFSQHSQPNQLGHHSWWGRIPSLHHRATNWTPLRPIHLPGTLQAPSSVRAQPAACSPLQSPLFHSIPAQIPHPIPAFPPSTHSSVPLESGSTHTQTPKESPAPLGLSAAHAVYSAGFGAVGQGQPWALVPAAWLTSAQPCSIWGAPSSCPSTTSPAEAFPCGVYHLPSREMELCTSLWHPGTKAKHWAEELTPGQVKSCPNRVFTTARAWERRLGWGGWLQPLLLSSCGLRAGSTLRGRWSRAGCCS